MAGGHQNQSQCGKDSHGQETFSTASHIHDFGQRDIHGGRHAVGNHIDDVQEGVGLPGTGDIGEQIVKNRGLKSVYKV